MKKIWSKWKTSTWFFKAMVIYAVLMVMGILGVCIWEWSKLSDYQNQYEEAKVNSNPWLYMEDYINELDKNAYTELLTQAIETNNPFVTKEAMIDHRIKEIDFSNINVVENQEYFNEIKPVYDILSNNQVIAIVSLKAKATDEFGFSIWETDQVVVDGTVETKETLEIILDNNMTAKINGVDVKDYVKGQEIKSDLYKFVGEASGREYGVTKYHVTGLLEGYSVEVTDKDGEKRSYGMVEEARDYTLSSDTAFKDTVKLATDQIVKKYISYSNKYAELDEMLAYTINNGQAYKALLSAEESMSWMRKPLDVHYLEEEIGDIRHMGSDVAYCDVHYLIEKDFSGAASDKLRKENVDFGIVLKNQNGRWMLYAMILKN